MPRIPASAGSKVFLTVLVGQVVSILGSSLTGFALGVWVFQRTGSATKFALIALFAVVPGILLSPVAGTLVDRWDRRRAMMLSDAGAGASTLVLALLIWAGRLEVWHIYLLLAISSTFGAFQWPAFTAATTLLVPKAHLGRASGMVQAGAGGAELLAPSIAGVLVGTIGIAGVVAIDIATFLFALLTLSMVRFPRLERPHAGTVAKPSLLREAAEGWSYLRERPALLALLGLFAAANFSLGMMQVLVTPLVLGFTSAAVLGAVVSTAGIGMLAGSVAMSIWGGPKRRIHGVLGGLLLEGVVLCLGGLYPSATLVAVAGFTFMLASPVITGSSQAIWQAKVPPELQGRVFAIRRMIAWSTLPLAFLLAGPLADRVFEPLLAHGGPLAGSVGRLIGTGPGRGIALLLIVLGALLVLSVALGLRSPRIRRVELELPDAIPDEPAAGAGTGLSTEARAGAR